MKIKMKTLSAGPNGVIRIGQIIDLPDAQAQAFISAGAAEQIQIIIPKPESQKPETETTDKVIRAENTAIQPQPRRGPGRPPKNGTV